MKLLSLDTSSPACTVAIVEADAVGGTVLSEINIWTPRGHMERLIPQIDSALHDAQVDKTELEGVVVGIGPGSFTGLRIGVSIARTFAQMLNVPIAGVPSFDAMVRRFALFNGIICPVVDAKRGEVYTALYSASKGSIERITEFEPLSPEALAYRLEDTEQDRFLFLGDGIGVYREIFESHLGDKAFFLPSDGWWPRAADLAFSAAPKLLEGKSDDPFSVVPIYARLSQAEEMWLKKEKHRQ